MHAAFGSPAISTFTHAIRHKFLASLPRLTSDLLAANPPHTTSTELEHLDQIRQGQHSIKRFMAVFPETEDSTLETAETIQDDSIIRNYMHVFVLTETMHSDLTGKFLVTSFSGMQYIIISVLDDYVHIEAMKSRHHLEYIAAYKRTINVFSKLGRKPIFQRFDRETSTALELFARSNGISIQYCAPHQHRALKAERAIRTFKNHFIATWCTVADDFPLGLWDELLPQAELCLNHLLPYSSNTSISAYAGLHGGAFDFAAHSIAPAGSKVVVHDKSAIGASWAPHGTRGYYLGTSQSHYRCYRVWTTSSRSIRIFDTLAWFLQGLQLPRPLAHDMFCSAVEDLTIATKTLFDENNIAGALHPTGQVINTLTSAVQQLSEMYPKHTRPSTETNTSHAAPHAENDQRVVAECINPATAPEHRVSEDNEVQRIPEGTSIETNIPQSVISVDQEIVQVLAATISRHSQHTDYSTKSFKIYYRSTPTNDRQSHTSRHQKDARGSTGIANISNAQLG